MFLSQCLRIDWPKEQMPLGWPRFIYWGAAQWFIIMFLHPDTHRPVAESSCLTPTIEHEHHSMCMNGEMNTTVPVLGCGRMAGSSDTTRPSLTLTRLTMIFAKRWSCPTWRVSAGSWGTTTRYNTNSNRRLFVIRTGCRVTYTRPYFKSLTCTAEN